MQETGEALTTAPQTIGLTTGIRTALPGLPGGAALLAGDTLGPRVYRRRAFLGASALAVAGTVGAPRFLVAAAAAPPSTSTASFPLQPLALDGAAAPAENGGPAAIEHAAADASPAPALTHEAFRAEVARLAALSPAGAPLPAIKQLFQETASRCVLDDGAWIIPSRNYAAYFFSRDSFWLCAALRQPQLSGVAVAKFAADQAANPDGHVATALRYDAGRPPERDRDDESTLLYVLHNYLWFTLGGTAPRDSLLRAYQFIQSHVVDGRYVTRGEVRTGAPFAGSEQIGTYHYWADTYRPTGRPEAAPAVVAYNQGLYCLALRCLEAMGVGTAADLAGARAQAELVYAGLGGAPDGAWLPQREGAAVVDVSALVPEALSLYFFDRPLLSTEKVQATVEHLAPARYPDGSFLGFKVISDAAGRYRPSAEFSGSGDNAPGDYQNGGSWLLYDALALYAAARHGIDGSADLFWQRLRSEVSRSWASHEFISTNPRTPGYSQPWRDGYGWNTFVANLLP